MPQTRGKIASERVRCHSLALHVTRASRHRGFWLGRRQLMALLADDQNVGLRFFGLPVYLNLEAVGEKRLKPKAMLPRTLRSAHSRVFLVLAFDVEVRRIDPCGRANDLIGQD